MVLTVPLASLEPNSDRYWRSIQRCGLSRRSTGLGTARRPGVARVALIGMDVFRRLGSKCGSNRDVDVGVLLRSIPTGGLSFFISANMPSSLDRISSGCAQATINKLYGSIKSSRNASPAIRQGVGQAYGTATRPMFIVDLGLVHMLYPGVLYAGLLTWEDPKCRGWKRLGRGSRGKFNADGTES
ncbi:hypothetical protein RHS03_06486, partial [Rhizoctonia solani]